ncbi:MAG: hypothetical protein HC842_09680, partial [Cytophagales bacterium]|nr:hypothetical protein [Cytophagales bacterium]
SFDLSAQVVADTVQLIPAKAAYALGPGLRKTFDAIAGWPQPGQSVAFYLQCRGMRPYQWKFHTRDSLLVAVELWSRPDPTYAALDTLVAYPR